MSIEFIFYIMGIYKVEVISMDRFKFEIKIFHIFNGLAWTLAFILYSITEQAKPQDIDMFNYGIESKLSSEWNTELIDIGKWVLLLLCVVCIISFFANLVMSLDAKKRFSISQLIITLLTIWSTVYYFSNFTF